jgi:hypothetical protein
MWRTRAGIRRRLIEEAELTPAVDLLELPPGAP